MAYVNLMDVTLPDWAGHLAGMELFAYASKLMLAKLVSGSRYRAADIGKVVALPTPLDIAYLCCRAYRDVRDGRMARTRDLMQGTEFEW